MFSRRWLASWQLVAVLTLAGGAAFGKSYYSSVNLDSDILGVAHETDPLCINPWGLVTGTGADLHVADEATNVATLYGTDGGLRNFSASASGTNHFIAIPTGAPTGAAEDVYTLTTTATDDFNIATTSTSGVSHYLYCTEDGNVDGYNVKVSATTAILGANVSGAGFTGMALSWSGTEHGVSHLTHYAYVADFAQEKIIVFDRHWNQVTLTGTFADTIGFPTPPGGDAWSPFNIHTLDYTGRVFNGDKVGPQRLLIVTYALHNHTSNTLNDIPAAANGIVDLYKTDGTFVRRLVTGGPLNSPWGVAVAHTSLPQLKPSPITVLIGNHGDGTINAYAIDPLYPDLGEGKYLGTLIKDADGNQLAFDGLWALHFGIRARDAAAYAADPGDLSEDDFNLYFSAGINSELDGLIGRIVRP